MVLGGRHLIGIFALLVVILGVVFTLGYLLGRNQYDAQLNPSVEAATRRVEKPASKAEGKAGKTVPAANQQPPADDTAPAPANWDFYHSGEESKTPAHLDAKPKPVTAKPARPAAAGAEPKTLVAHANADAAKTAPIPAKATVVPSKNTASPTINVTRQRGCQCVHCCGAIEYAANSAGRDGAPGGGFGAGGRRPRLGTGPTAEEISGVCVDAGRGSFLPCASGSLRRRAGRQCRPESTAKPRLQEHHQAVNLRRLASATRPVLPDALE